MNDFGDSSDASGLLCHRCGRTLERGRGAFYLVRIEAVCDPSPPTLDENDTRESLSAEYEAAHADLAGTSEQEAMDQVYRRLVLHLCTPCYQQWIENPL